MRCHWHSYLIVKEDQVQIHISKYTCLNISHVFLQTYWDKHRWQEAYNDDNQHKLQLKNKIAGQNRRLQLPATTSFLTALGILNMGESNPWKGGLPEQQPKRGTVAIMCELRWPKLRHQDISMIRKQQMAHNLRGNLNNPLGKKKKLTKTGGVFVWGGGVVGSSFAARLLLFLLFGVLGTSMVPVPMPPQAKTSSQILVGNEDTGSVEC